MRCKCEGKLSHIGGEIYYCYKCRLFYKAKMISKKKQNGGYVKKIVPHSKQGQIFLTQQLGFLLNKKNQ